MSNKFTLYECDVSNYQTKQFIEMLLLIHAFWTDNSNYQHFFVFKSMVRQLPTIIYGELRHAHFIKVNLKGSVRFYMSVHNSSSLCSEYGQLGLIDSLKAQPLN